MVFAPHIITSSESNGAMKLKQRIRKTGRNAKVRFEENYNYVSIQVCRNAAICTSYIVCYEKSTRLL